MMWWVKARRAHTVLPATLGLFALLLVFLQGDSVALPSLTSGATHVVLALFIPIPLVSGLALCLDTRLHADESTAIRPVRYLDCGLVITVAVVAAAMSTLAGGALGDPAIQAVGRNTLFLTGLMLIGRALFGLPGVLLPTAWILAVCLCGFRPGNDAYPWTVLPEPLGAPHAAAGAVLMFGAGLVVQIRYTRTPS
ncbi:hypothetical protein GA0115233_101870 [Streptomyces sp. DI166]|uniref:hypothetical protein n=1 Tax=Streptomyces sp. DI166 TaxID=1839783 RepID=UPI0007F46F97|nr:hypothetical protein [Streptomyces sp. DI166]SBT90415.1 hypothetical protein GA0115233_101870 [Streptomyces sp. DI166]